MPIYAYRCESCGFEKDVLQKMSDAPLTQCPECTNDTFRKQLTAAGFQLKGSGWYVTDFRGGSNGAGKAAGKAESGADATGSGTSAGETKSDTASAPAASTPAAASTPSAPATSSTADA